MENQLEITLKNNKLLKDIDLSKINFNEIKGSLSLLKEGELLFKEGDPAKNIYLVVSGEISLFKKKLFRKTKSIEISENEFFGNEALIENGRRIHSAVALDDTYIISLTKSEADKLIAQDERILMNLGGVEGMPAEESELEITEDEIEKEGKVSEEKPVEIIIDELLTDEVSGDKELQEVSSDLGIDENTELTSEFKEEQLSAELEKAIAETELEIGEIDEKGLTEISNGDDEKELVFDEEAADQVDVSEVEEQLSVEELHDETEKDLVFDEDIEEDMIEALAEELASDEFIENEPGEETIALVEEDETTEKDGQDLDEMEEIVELEYEEVLEEESTEEHYEDDSLIPEIEQIHDVEAEEFHMPDMELTEDFEEEIRIDLGKFDSDREEQIEEQEIMESEKEEIFEDKEELQEKPEIDLSEKEEPTIFEDAAMTKEQFKLIKEAAKSFNTILEYDELIPEITNAAMSFTNANRGSLYVFDKDKNELWTKVFSEGTTKELRINVGEGITGGVAQNGEIVNIINADEDDRFNADLEKISDYKTSSMLCFPINDKDENVVAVLQLLNSANESFSGLDEDFLNELSFHISAALENAEQFEQKMKAERSSSLNKMTSFLIQDIKKPVLVSKRYAEHLKGKEMPDEVVHIIDMLLDQINQAADIVHTTTSFTFGKSTLRVSPTSLNQTLDDFINRLESYISMKSCQVTKEYDDDINVKLDLKEFYQCFNNLIKNATDAMPEGGKITILTKRKAPFVNIYVKDTGLGIPHNHREKIFEPFMSFGKEDRTGLGLSITKKIIEDHGGKISFESEQGVGTTFTISLPVASNI